MNRSLIVLVTLVSLAACNSPKEKALTRIKGMEASDSVFSPAAIADLKAAYLDFANKYPDDEMSPEFIFKAAQRCNAVSMHQEAIGLFNSILQKYPKSKLCEEALFLQGYIYENNLQDYSKAKEIYTEFVSKYPDSELTEDAKLSIQNLGKSPEEIFESFHGKDSIS